MGRILAIDYGQKRSGVAVTDTLRIAANPLPVVNTNNLLKFISDYCEKETVDLIVIGHPKTLNGKDSDSMKYIRPFIGRLKKALPLIPIQLFDERFTSSIAHREMIAAGFKRSDRQRKGLADEMAATIILTDWLQAQNPI
ncbi:MAG: Holliday junction resolvase RuvX [Prevotella sp.]|nr:Holliday junction resolvase RuvX [Bacteroides sp.]MCM1366140.1 Holliday junction resolvase RuvX [Prevotella sp.]MCM1436795.1 Holliday junction resolvase RuvX [Prevotella sp.]